jgi:hypothetical protein
MSATEIDIHGLELVMEPFVTATVQVTVHGRTSYGTTVFVIATFALTSPADGVGESCLTGSWAGAKECEASPVWPTETDGLDHPRPTSPVRTNVRTTSAIVARFPGRFTEARRILMVTTFIT